MLVADAGYHCKESVEQGFEPCIAGSRERHDQPHWKERLQLRSLPPGLNHSRRTWIAYSSPPRNGGSLPAGSGCTSSDRSVLDPSSPIGRP